MFLSISRSFKKKYSKKYICSHNKGRVLPSTVLGTIKMSLWPKGVLHHLVTWRLNNLVSMSGFNHVVLEDSCPYRWHHLCQRDPFSPYLSTQICKTLDLPARSALKLTLPQLMLDVSHISIRHKRFDLTKRTYPHTLHSLLLSLSLVPLGFLTRVEEGVRVCHTS